jgi:hypothetical protein
MSSMLVVAAVLSVYTAPTCARAARGGEFPLGVEQALEPGGCQQHGMGELQSEQRDARVEPAHVAQHARQEHVGVQSLAVPGERALVAAAARQVVPCHRRQDRAGERFIFMQVHRERGGHVRQGNGYFAPRAAGEASACVAARDGTRIRQQARAERSLPGARPGGRSRIPSAPAGFDARGALQ